MQRETTIFKNNDVTRNWYIVDATNKPLGRLASEIAKVLMGKNKPQYTPNFDTGDYVIVTNCSKVYLSGTKLTKKMYYDNKSETYGGLRTRSAKVMVKDYPTEMIRRAVWGMLPKGSLGKQMVKKLFVFANDADEARLAKKPVAVELTAKKEM